MSHLTIRVTAPEGMMSIPDISSGDYNLDDPQVKQQFDKINLWDSLIFMEPGQKVVFECVSRVDNDPCVLCGEESDMTMTVFDVIMPLCEGCMGRVVDGNLDAHKGITQYVLDKKVKGANQ